MHMYFFSNGYSQLDKCLSAYAKAVRSKHHFIRNTSLNNIQEQTGLSKIFSIDLTYNRATVYLYLLEYQKAIQGFQSGEYHSYLLWLMPWH